MRIKPLEGEVFIVFIVEDIMRFVVEIRDKLSRFVVFDSGVLK